MNGFYFASGGNDRRIIIWDISKINKELQEND